MYRKNKNLEIYVLNGKESNNLPNGKKKFNRAHLELVVVE